MISRHWPHESDLLLIWVLTLTTLLLAFAFPAESGERGVLLIAAVLGTLELLALTNRSDRACCRDAEPHSAAPDDYMTPEAEEEYLELLHHRDVLIAKLLASHENPPHRSAADDAAHA